jgi:hypothetical protein
MAAWVAAGTVQADVLTLEPVADATLYDVAAGDQETANGRGVHLFAGRIAGGLRRRALLRFDLNAIPPGSTINSAQLSMSLTRVPPGTLPAVNFSLMPMTAIWGEGTSDAGDPGGNGALATVGDTTWTQRVFPAMPWASAGGDFVAAASAVTSANNLGRYQWGSGPSMVSAVQSWVDAPGSNFGWMLIADEAAGELTARRFASHEATDASTRPNLVIDYTLSGGVPPVGNVSGIPTLSMLGVVALGLLVLWLGRLRLRWV